MGLGRVQTFLCFPLWPHPVQPSLLSPPLDASWFPLDREEQEALDFLRANSPNQVTTASWTVAVPGQVLAGQSCCSHRALHPRALVPLAA